MKQNKEETNDTSKELLNIFHENKPQENNTSKKGGFSFIKNNGKNNVVDEKNDLNNVFQNLNMTGEEKTTDVSKTLQDTLNKKIDLDKLYQENNTNNTNHVNQNAINSLHFNQVPPQQFFNNNFGVQNISYHQNYDLGINFNNAQNVKIENYTPLDMKDYNQQAKQQAQDLPKKNEKDHFDFVNDLMKKKK